MPNQAGLNIIVGWDDSKVQKGIADLKKMFSSGGLGGLSVDSSGAIKGLNSVNTSIQELKKNLKATKDDFQSFLAGGGSAASAQGQQLAAAYNQVNNQLQQINRTTKGTQDAYARLSRLANEATRHAQNLGVQYGTTSQQFLVASQRANNLTQRLQEIDAATGRHFRNVGNYASGYNAISVNMARIVGEMPNFTMSMRLGFMAISNNIQPLYESIQQLVRINRELAAQGQPTTSALKAVGGALFSWNTLLLVGVTALTAYGPKMVEWIRSLDKGYLAAKRLREEHEALVKSQESANKTAGEQIGKLTTLNNVLLSNTASAKAKKGAYDQLIKMYPSYQAELEKEYIRTGNVANVINTQLVPAIIAAAQARAHQARIDDLSSKNLDKQNKQIEIGRKQNEANLRVAKAQEAYDKVNNVFQDRTNAYTLAKGELALAVKEQDKLKTSWQDIQKEINNNTKVIDSYANVVSGLQPKLGNLTTDGVDAGKYATKPKKDTLSDAEKEAKKYAEALAELERALSMLNKEFEGGFLSKEDFDKKRLDVLSAAYKKFFVDLKQAKDTTFMKGLFADLLGAQNTVQLNEAKKKAGEIMSNLAKEQSDKWKKEVEENIKNQEQAYSKILDSAQDYHQQRINAERDFNQQIAGLERNKSNLTKAEYDRQKKLITNAYNNTLNELAFSNSKIFKKLNADIGRASSEQLKELYDELDKIIKSGKMLDSSSKLIDVPPETLKRFEQARDSIKGLIADVIKLKLESSNVGKLALAFGELGASLQEVGKSLDSAGFNGSVIGSMGNMLASLSSAFLKLKTITKTFNETFDKTQSSATALKEVFKSKDWIALIVQIIGVVISMIGAFKRYKESLEELQREVAAKTIEIYLAEFEISEELREQNRLKAEGIRLTYEQLAARKKVLEENKKQIDEEVKQITDKIKSVGEAIGLRYIDEPGWVGKLFGKKAKENVFYGSLGSYSTNDVLEYFKKNGFSEDLLKGIIKEGERAGRITSTYLESLAGAGVFGMENSKMLERFNNALNQLNADGKKIYATFNDLKELKYAGLLSAETEKLVDQLIDLENQGVDVTNALKDLDDYWNEIFTATTADNITDAIAKGFENGKRSITDFADDFEGLMRQAMINSLKYQYLQAPIQDFYDKFSEYAKSGNELTSGEISELNTIWGNIINNAKVFADGLEKATGLTLSTPGAKSVNTLQGSIKESLTEETGTILAGSIKGTQLAMVGVLNFHLTDTRDFYNTSIAYSINMLEQAILISKNTGNIDNNTKDIVPVLRSIDSKMNNSTNQARAAGF